MLSEASPVFVRTKMRICLVFIHVIDEETRSRLAYTGGETICLGYWVALSIKLLSHNIGNITNVISVRGTDQIVSNS